MKRSFKSWESAINNLSQVGGFDRGRQICTKVTDLWSLSGQNVSFDSDGNGQWFKEAISASDIAMWNLKFFIPCYFLSRPLFSLFSFLSFLFFLLSPSRSHLPLLFSLYITSITSIPVRTIISFSRINCLLKYSKPLGSRNPRHRTNFWYQRDPRTICIFLRHDPPAAQAGSNLCILLVNVIRFLRAAPRSAKAADKFFTNRVEASWPTSRPALFIVFALSISLISYITMKQGAFVDVPWPMNDEYFNGISFQHSNSQMIFESKDNWYFSSDYVPTLSQMSVFCFA